MEVERQFNSLFKSDTPTRLNACVGNNGIQDSDTYAKGYMDAGIVMAEEVIKGNAHYVDTLIFPIVFCMRHSIELQLKSFIKKIMEFYTSKELSAFDINKSHDIGKLWKIYAENSNSADRRFVSKNRELEAYVDCFSEIDPTGQVFRYPEDNRETRHLTRTPVINIKNLKQKFSEARELLRSINFLADSLVIEYKLGTTTNNLSRFDLYTIAKELPARSLWKEECFKEKKEEIAARFNLTSRAFSRAVDTIQKNHEFSGYIESPIPLSYISEEEFNTFISFVRRYDDLNLAPPNEHSVFNVAEIAHLLNSEEEFSIIQECVSSIKHTSLAELTAIYYLGREGYPIYSENFASILKREISDAEHAYQNHDLVVYCEHFFSKTNIISSMTFGLKSLGQNNLIAQLNQMFSDQPHKVQLPDLDQNYS